MAAHLAQQRSLPVFEVSSIGGQTRYRGKDSKYLDAQPPIVCSATDGGRRVGWVLVFEAPDAQFKLAGSIFHEIAMAGLRMTVNNKCWRDRNKVMFEQGSAVQAMVLYMVGIKEWARVFCASPAQSKDEGYVNRYFFGNAVPEGSGWRVTDYHFTVYKQSPHGFNDWKCCMASQLHSRGCQSCGSVGAGTGCSGTEGGCLKKHKKMIWCRKCMISPFCSKECRDKCSDEHSSVCAQLCSQYKAIGLGRACFFCGTPETAEGKKLKHCKGCEAAYYCSVECQTSDWHAGHKLDCVKAGAGSEGLGARSSRSPRNRVPQPDDQIAAEQRRLDEKRTDMVRLFERMKLQGVLLDSPCQDCNNPWHLVQISEIVAVAEAKLTGSPVARDLCISSTVIVHSLTSATQHNDVRGMVSKMPESAGGRYVVAMDGGKTIRVSGGNLCDVTDLHRAVGLTTVSPGRSPGMGLISVVPVTGLGDGVLEERLCAQPLPETSNTAQDGAARAEREQEQKEERLRERKAGKEKRRQQAREKEQQQAIEEEAGAGAMEAPPPAEAMDDDKSMAVFLEWSDVLGYDNLERFRTADDDDYACLPLSSEQLDRVLLLLEERDPATWSDAKAVSPAAPAMAETADGR